MRTPQIESTKSEIISRRPPSEILCPVIRKLIQMIPELEERERQHLAKQAQEAGD